MSDLIIQTNETVRQIFFMDAYISHEVPLLFVGPTGTGKSAIANDQLIGMPKDR